MKIISGRVKTNPGKGKRGLYSKMFACIVKGYLFFETKDGRINMVAVTL